MRSSPGSPLGLPFQVCFASSMPAQAQFPILRWRVLLLVLLVLSNHWHWHAISTRVVLPKSLSEPAGTRVSGTQGRSTRVPGYQYRAWSLPGMQICIPDQPGTRDSAIVRGTPGTKYPGTWEPQEVIVFTPPATSCRGYPGTLKMKIAAPAGNFIEHHLRICSGGVPTSSVVFVSFREDVLEQYRWRTAMVHQCTPLCSENSFEGLGTHCKRDRKL